MKAYFATPQQAQRAADRLGINFEVTKPEPVRPFNGRGWRIEVTLPAPFMSQFPDPVWSSQVVSVVLAFDGIVHSDDMP
jgi:hypothetical protein